MIVDLSIGLDEGQVYALDYVQIDQVVHSATTAAELVAMLQDMPLAYPSYAEDWDYKDVSAYVFGKMYEICQNVEGLTITGQSEGPRDWFISFTFNGEESGLGPGYSV